MIKELILDVKNLSKKYQNGSEELQVLNSIDLQVYAKDFLTIMGQSGSGKSTLLKIIGLLDQKYTGEIKYNDQDLRTLDDKQLSLFRGLNIGFVFQDFQLIERLTVYKNLELALISAGLINKKENEKAIRTVLSQVDLSDKMNVKCRNLSGGQKQRISIARALVKKPKLIIADEPTGALDRATSTEIMNLLVKLNELGNTIIIVTHDQEVAKIAKKNYLIIDGKLEHEKI